LVIPQDFPDSAFVGTRITTDHAIFYTLEDKTDYVLTQQNYYDSGSIINTGLSFLRKNLIVSGTPERDAIRREEPPEIHVFDWR